ncbi:hypothetical protein VB713_21670 [Anabaena cylindrica UHCC 0172]|uniref:hypothetical protein n=1 Tax=Anabaena cylindrica TaxID=1165 RepID=UPI002B21F265|nr:hypothetical protein [Anabaena cylindrica]MEA5553553.1 hypothetical protein [Anabaena cylindrica UHCC 0172]
MLHTFTFPQEMIDSIQERIEVLERCLNNANSQDEAIAEMIELANNRQLSLSQLSEENRKFGNKLNRFNKLRQALNEKVNKDQLAVLLCVRCNFALKEIVDIYWYLLLKKDSIEILIELTKNFVEIFNQIKINSRCELELDIKNELYIIVESLKHLIQSLIKASLQVNALSEEEINAFNLGDITTQESEAMLISLASTEKWDYVYRKLA